jgi:hypothetical protein
MNYIWQLIALKLTDMNMISTSSDSDTPRPHAFIFQQIPPHNTSVARWNNRII